MVLALDVQEHEAASYVNEVHPAAARLPERAETLATGEAVNPAVVTLVKQPGPTTHETAQALMAIGFLLISLGLYLSWAHFAPDSGPAGPAPDSCPAGPESGIYLGRDITFQGGEVSELHGVVSVRKGNVTFFPHSVRQYVLRDASITAMVSCRRQLLSLAGQAVVSQLADAVVLRRDADQNGWPVDVSFLANGADTCHLLPPTPLPTSRDYLVLRTNASSDAAVLTASVTHGGGSGETIDFPGFPVVAVFDVSSPASLLMLYQDQSACTSCWQTCVGISQEGALLFQPTWVNDDVHAFSGSYLRCGELMIRGTMFSGRFVSAQMPGNTPTMTGFNGVIDGVIDVQASLEDPSLHVHRSSAIIVAGSSARNVTFAGQAAVRLPVWSSLTAAAYVNVSGVLSDFREHTETHAVLAGVFSVSACNGTTGDVQIDGRAYLGPGLFLMNGTAVVNATAYDASVELHSNSTVIAFSPGSAPDPRAAAAVTEWLTLGTVRRLDAEAVRLQRKQDSLADVLALDGLVSAVVADLETIRDGLAHRHMAAAEALAQQVFAMPEQLVACNISTDAVSAALHSLAPLRQRLDAAVASVNATLASRASDHRLYLASAPFALRALVDVLTRNHTVSIDFAVPYNCSCASAGEANRTAACEVDMMMQQGFAPPHPVIDRLLLAANATQSQELRDVASVLHDWIRSLHEWRDLYFHPLRQSIRRVIDAAADSRGVQVLVLQPLAAGAPAVDHCVLGINGFANSSASVQLISDANYFGLRPVAVPTMSREDIQVAEGEVTEVDDGFAVQNGTVALRMTAEVDPPVTLSNATGYAEFDDDGNLIVFEGEAEVSMPNSMISLSLSRPLAGFGVYRGSLLNSKQWTGFEARVDPDLLYLSFFFDLTADLIIHVGGAVNSSLTVPGQLNPLGFHLDFLFLVDPSVAAGPGMLIAFDWKLPEPEHFAALDRLRKRVACKVSSIRAPSGKTETGSSDGSDNGEGTFDGSNSNGGGSPGGNGSNECDKQAGNDKTKGDGQVNGTGGSSSSGGSDDEKGSSDDKDKDKGKGPEKILQAYLPEGCFGTSLDLERGGLIYYDPWLPAGPITSMRVNTVFCADGFGFSAGLVPLALTGQFFVDGPLDSIGGHSPFRVGIGFNGRFGLDRIPAIEAKLKRLESKSRAALTTVYEALLPLDFAIASSMATWQPVDHFQIVTRAKVDAQLMWVVPYDGLPFAPVAELDMAVYLAQQGPEVTFSVEASGEFGVESVFGSYSILGKMNITLPGSLLLHGHVGEYEDQAHDEDYDRDQRKGVSVEFKQHYVELRVYDPAKQDFTVDAGAIVRQEQERLERLREDKAKAEDNLADMVVDVNKACDKFLDELDSDVEEGIASAIKRADAKAKQRVPSGFEFVSYERENGTGPVKNPKYAVDKHKKTLAARRAVNALKETCRKVDDGLAELNSRLEFGPKLLVALQAVYNIRTLKPKGRVCVKTKDKLLGVPRIDCGDDSIGTFKLIAEDNLKSLKSAIALVKQIPATDTWIISLGELLAMIPDEDLERLEQTLAKADVRVTNAGVGTETRYGEVIPTPFALLSCHADRPPVKLFHPIKEGATDYDTSDMAQLLIDSCLHH